MNAIEQLNTINEYDSLMRARGEIDKVTPEEMRRDIQKRADREHAMGSGTIVGNKPAKKPHVCKVPKITSSNKQYFTEGDIWQCSCGIKKRLLLSGAEDVWGNPRYMWHEVITFKALRPTLAPIGVTCLSIATFVLAALGSPIALLTVFAAVILGVFID